MHWSEAEGEGIGPADIRRWRARGQVRTVGTWYVTQEAPADLVALLELGVRPTCLDAASLYGLFVPVQDGAHVFRPRTSRPTRRRPQERVAAIRRKRDPETGQLVPTEHTSTRSQGLVLHSPQLRTWPDHSPVPELSLVLEHVGRCLSTSSAAVVMESALHQGLLGAGELRSVLASLPGRLSTPLRRVRSDAESGTETAVRWWLESLRVPVRSQVVIPTVGRVDLLIGNSWIIECDSSQFHDDPEQYHRDRARDLRLRSLGYTVTRLTWEQVFLHWDRTEQMLLAVIRRRDHRRRPAA